MTNKHFNKNKLISFGICVWNCMNEDRISFLCNIRVIPFAVVNDCCKVVSLTVNTSSVKFKIEAFHWFQYYSGVGSAGAVVESFYHAVNISLVFLNHGLKKIMESEIVPIILNSHNLHNLMILALCRWWKWTQEMIHNLLVLLCAWWNFHLQISIKLNRSPVLWQLYGW